MAVTQVAVRFEGGRKRVFLRDVDRETIPWKYTTVKEAEALSHAHPHERNCKSEEEAERYYRMLVKS